MPETILKGQKNRVIRERTELGGRITKLSRFTKTPEFAKLPVDERNRLAKQFGLMNDLHQILTERIDADFK